MMSKEEKETILGQSLKTVSISALARIAKRDWGQRGKLGVAPGVMSYLAKLLDVRDIREYVGSVSARDLVHAFLDNADKWHGPIAREVKRELNRRLGE